ncbi:MAG: hypothetical protein ACLQNV_10530 [Steroidobacteraceae bacterium]
MSTDARAEIGAVAWIRDRKRRSDYKENGGRVAIGDLVWTEGWTPLP